jgi:DNA-binding response OmpR family regulator
MATKIVVLVEDDLAISTVLRVELELRGLIVHSAVDGLAGLALIRKTRPDAILLDIKMPKMNGYQLCTALQNDPATAAIPILVMTGLTSEDGTQPDRVWRDRLGVADFVSKPFDVVNVVERTFAMIEHRESPPDPQGARTP